MPMFPFKYSSKICARLQGYDVVFGLSCLGAIISLFC
jgi:hypothetical protein